MTTLWGLASKISIKNFSLIYWKKSIFEAIGRHFGCLVSISSQTLNGLDCYNVVREVQNNICGFIPVEIDFKDPNLRDFSLRFGDVVPFGSLKFEVF